MDTRHQGRRSLDFLTLALVLTTIACSDNGSDGESDGGGTGGSGGSGGTNTGGSAPGTGLPSGTACIRVEPGAETCVASGVRSSRSLSGGEISMSVYQLASGTDYCYDDTASDFVLIVRIPDGLPFPYQANQRPGRASFRANANCYYQGNEGPYVSGTIYQAATNGATHLEGDVSVQYNGQFSGVCGMGCPQSVAARFRFNVPL